MDPRAAHWQNVYQTKQDQETSWFQDEPTPSLGLIKRYAPAGVRVIDVGGGASNLAGRLVESGYDVTVLDISQAAIDRAKIRNGEMAKQIQWVVADVTRAANVGAFGLWHDRAVFHFLTDAAERRAYAELAGRSIAAGGHLVLGTFAVDGPEKCSGLPVMRHDEGSMEEAFGGEFGVIETFHETHVTPWGKAQAFFFAVMKRR